MNEPLRVIYMGTPEFAVPALSALHKSGHRVDLVVTQPDRPKGRGKKVLPPPVKRAAVELGYPVIQPESPKTAEVIRRLRDTAPDVFVVIAYGHILNRELLDIPVMGAINIHASLLPRYRGPAPIQWAVINGETETGITAMRMDAGMDTGDILMAEKEPILSDDTSADLHDRLAERSAGLLLRTLEDMRLGRTQGIPQDHTLATYAPMLKKADGRIDWRRSAEKIDAFVRGMSPWPGAFTFDGDRRLKIFSVEISNLDSDMPPGTVVDGFPDELTVSTGKGCLIIRKIQGASGKRLHIRDFLRGHPMSPGTRLG